jgi:hypothetical protein
MSYSNYTLDIISSHPKFSGKSLKKYSVDGIETVGAWGDEPFEIRFKNNTWQTVQVKISIDGTDIMTGELASTEPSEKMWLVKGYSTLSLKAWPESNNGGARFVFTSGENGVAANTHGNVSSRGIIAAAVYIEGHVTPTLYYTPICNCYGNCGCGTLRLNNYFTWSNDHHSRRKRLQTNSSNTLDTKSTAFISDSRSYNSFNVTCNTAPVASNSINLNDSDSSTVGSLTSVASVGAGEYVSQNISYVQGLVKPTFSETIRVRYLWWDELETKLKGSSKIANDQPTGFPADKKNINLGATPRVKSAAAGYVHRSENPIYTRF